MAATAYAAGTGGVIFDHERGKQFTPAQGTRVRSSEFFATVRDAEALMEEVKRKFASNS